MSRTAFDLTLARAEGALIRTLGLVERRGWRVVEARFTPEPQGRDRLRLELEARRAGAEPAVLARQLARLIDVEAITAAPEGFRP